jgi:hypothetical protein
VSDIYEIRVKGHLDRHWARHFEGMRIELLENGETRLCGAVVDQAALHGLLTRVRDLGLTLMLVRRSDEECSDR